MRERILLFPHQQHLQSSADNVGSVDNKLCVVSADRTNRQQGDSEGTDNQAGMKMPIEHEETRAFWSGPKNA